VSLGDYQKTAKTDESSRNELFSGNYWRPHLVNVVFEIVLEKSYDRKFKIIPKKHRYSQISKE
jgi:hypothetical protein